MNISKNSSCEICGSKFILGPHIYDGRYLPKYGITVCMRCFFANGGGWAPHLEPAVTASLRQRNLPIPPWNESGLLPRE